jgi:hypothetical protein
MRAKVLKDFVSGNATFKPGQELDSSDPACPLNPKLFRGLGIHKLLELELTPEEKADLEQVVKK